MALSVSEMLWFTAKVWVFLFVFMWLRATLHRLRYDQFMALGWKILIPVWTHLRTTSLKASHSPRQSGDSQLTL